MLEIRGLETPGIVHINMHKYRILEIRGLETPGIIYKCRRPGDWRLRGSHIQYTYIYYAGDMGTGDSGDYI